MSERANFKNTLGIILATAGSAVGLGNVWRFPYIAGENGGASYIIIYIICVLLLGIPCMVSEFIIGRHSASNTARAYNKMGNRWWGIVGLLSVATGFLITCYYVIVSGWCFQYMYATLAGELNGNADYYIQYFNDFSSNPWKPVVCAVAFMAVTHFVIIHGIRGGIERASKVLMPALFVLLLVIVVSSCMLPGASKGIEFLLFPDFSKINANVFLDAMGQSFYSLSIGMGCICTYASYFSRRTNLSRSAIQISVIDCMVAILAGLMIFPAAFSVGVQPDSGPSLIYITLPNVFQQAFSAAPFVGKVVSFAFYALMSLAALTSLISLHEVSTAFFQEELKISRRVSALIVSCGTGFIGIFCSLSLGGVDWLTFNGMTMFDIFDFVTGQIFLPIVGFFACLFIGWYVPKSVVRDEFTNWGTLKGSLFGLFLFCVRFICPTGILAVFVNQLLS
ncbi:MAG: sodium-dependent transporter [Prevotella sp.]|nr:sodium-dependent transporter [Prevotella sp.]MDY5034668.1 sodium-dependent transporter [Prevotella sp.]